MRALAMTGIDTAAMIASMRSGSLMRATPPCALMSAGTRSSAITATAPASSAILAWSAVTTSMITPPLSISAMPRFTPTVPLWPVTPDGAVLAFSLEPDSLDNRKTLSADEVRRNVRSVYVGRHLERLGVWLHVGHAEMRRSGVVHLEKGRRRDMAGQSQPAHQPVPPNREGRGDRVVEESASQQHLGGGRL